ncbi:hypothetical protein PCANC_01499 [Puccinia coronata f. sp. avenae]|uniref:Uncharacterized protein n=1 Tax=Puccinia coronata f. sp. avenae TaxID=200324 RepID=A0A2N5W2X1_9BASI|nr:hypothetical protein PCANC_01499 [Puccinia coronata f. sp. avenae]
MGAHPGHHKITPRNIRMMCNLEVSTHAKVSFPAPVHLLQPIRSDPMAHSELTQSIYLNNERECQMRKHTFWANNADTYTQDLFEFPTKYVGSESLGFHDLTTMPSSSSYQLSTLEGFVSGALSACVAVTFTNPMEVAKTRLQLDGESMSKGSPKTYTNPIDVLRKIVRNEGFRACQKGLGAAYMYQFALNGSRLVASKVNRIACWARSLKVKARLQAHSAVPDPSIGKITTNPNSATAVLTNSQIKSSLSPHRTRYAYKSAMDGLDQIFKAEGLKGLMRGVDAAMMRTAMSSSIQLPAYNYAKTNLAPYFSPDSFWLYIASSSFSGLCVLGAMQPADTALTRMYNQFDQSGKRLYKNPIDCLWKTVRIEGFTGL